MKQIKEQAELPGDDIIRIIDPTEEEIAFIEFLRKGEADLERAKSEMGIAADKLNFHKSYSEKRADET